MVENPPANSGEMGLIPGSETTKIPTCPRATKPEHLEPTLCNRTSHHNEKPEHHD